MVYTYRQTSESLYIDTPSKQISMSDNGQILSSVLLQLQYNDTFYITNWTTYNYNLLYLSGYDMLCSACWLLATWFQ